LLCGLGLALLVGCQDEEIKSYTAPKAEEPVNVRLLGIILPHGKEMWFYKLLGPEKGVKDHADEFAKFAASSKFTDKEAEPLTWADVPKGWERQPGKGMRYASFQLGTKEEPLELTVIRLPQEGNDVVLNVSRWRQQIGLGSVHKEEQLKEMPKQVWAEKIAGEDATRVDMLGVTTRKAGGGEDKLPDLPGLGPKQSALRYSKPEGWMETADPPNSPFPREAVFRVGGDKTAEVSASVAGGGLLANVNRWRTKQLGLKPIDEADLKKLPRIDVDGEKGTYVELGNDDEKILAAVVEHDGKQWFFKMKGPVKVVDDHASEFKDFLKSVKFGGGEGGAP
jgi:hypothetical protein